MPTRQALSRRFWEAHVRVVSGPAATVATCRHCEFRVVDRSRTGRGFPMHERLRGQAIRHVKAKHGGKVPSTPRKEGDE